MKREHKAGFTMIELAISLTLLVVVLVKLTMVINDASETHRKESVAMAVEDQAYQVLDRISYAIIGADPDTLTPGSQLPFFDSQLTYTVSLGVDDGEVVWSDPEIIGLAEDRSQVYWGRNVGEETERIVVWCNTVSDLLEDEFVNGIDDNENGLTDELGLSFVLSGNSVTIRLTLERQGKGGEAIRKTVETVVTCRN